MTTSSANVAQFPAGAAPAATREAISQALGRIAPLWPLDSFVAVNPFLGFTEESFQEASRRVELAYGGRMYMPRAFYAAAIEKGRITDADIKTALDRVPGAEGFFTSDVREYLKEGEEGPVHALPTAASVMAELTGRDWSDLVVERISHWAAAYFDQGQAAWPSPFKNLTPYAAWKAEMSLDYTDTVLGLHDAQEQLKGMPDTAQGMCEYALQRLSIPEPLLDLYLHRLLASISGWVAHSRYRGWLGELAGEAPEMVLDLLAIRLAWELLLVKSELHRGAELAWRRAMNQAVTDAALDKPASREQVMQQVLQEALEIDWQQNAIREIRAHGRENKPLERADAQLVFCIDVRSEVLRRAIESGEGDVETLGFAGFFGLPVEYVPLARREGAAHCPVLLKPALEVHESLQHQPAEVVTKLTRRMRVQRELARGWRAFKNSAVSCFVFVESYGLAYGFKLISSSLGLSRPEPNPQFRGLPPRLAGELGPQLAAVGEDGAALGLDRQIDFAESMLRGMSLTDSFARLVVLAGHGAHTTNNAHATSLDCGACGGQTGEASARIGAMILNNPAVRGGLTQRGINVPDDTHFLAALHITTTDDVTIFDVSEVPSTHAKDLADLQRRLGAAGEMARLERSRRLGIGKEAEVTKNLRRRTRDWSEVRPEWGLAGCAGFIAAPRPLTRSLNLDGRCFLHSYDHKQDKDYSVLELIMTAPMVVASWISLQYYGSSVDNRVFGAGNKTLHNVVGASVGVFEGNGGDLRVGLPLQSVHDGEKLMHEPQRLSVFIAAPIAAMNDVMERNASVRELADNGWINLFAVYDEGQLVARYRGNLEWEAAGEIAEEGVTQEQA